MDRWDDDLVVVPTWAVSDRRQILWWCEPHAPVILATSRDGSRLTLHRGTHEVTVDDVAIDLDKRATELLELLLLRGGEPVAIEDLRRAHGGEVLSATSCRVLVHRLRSSLGESLGQALVTARRRGYRWSEPVKVVDALALPHVDADARTLRGIPSERRNDG